MRATIRYMHDEITVPDGAKIGDAYEFTAKAIVTEISTELVDVTPLGRNPENEREVIPTESQATITLLNPRLA